jgi:methylated-DNA-[protein]-cysteine S-methyltransferase
MIASGFTLFETPVGRCGIAWGEHGIVAVQLPAGRDAETCERLLERCPAAQEATPSAEAQLAIDGLTTLLSGGAADLAGVLLDFDGVPPFHRRVYEVARTIAAGTTLSYGEVAARLGAPGAARAVGQALGRNPFVLVVPCHRVLAAGGRVGGFSAKGGITTKLRLLAIESAQAAVPPTGEPAVTLGFDPEVAVAHLRSADKALGRIIDRVGPSRLQLRRAPSLFVALAESIVYQQLNGRAAATIFARVRGLFPQAQDGPSAAQILRASDDKLRAAGLSANKLLSMKDLARRAVAGEIPTFAAVQSMSNEEIIEQLTEVRGIGRWTVEMLLIFRLGRPDVLPLDDLGVRKGFGIALKRSDLPTIDELLKRGERWRPYRTMASWYLWRATELPTA